MDNSKRVLDIYEIMKQLGIKHKKFKLQAEMRNLKEDEEVSNVQMQTEKEMQIECPAM